MAKYVKFLLFIIVFCGFIGPTNVQAQGNTVVALLVIDQFEVISPPTPLPEDPEIECVFTIDGQDSYRWEGAADGLTAILHPFPDPHGRQVYKTVGESLVAAGWSIDPLQTTNGDQVQSLPDDWMRDIEVWQQNGNEIYLVAVDTDAHSADAIVNRIKEAMTALDETWGITNFVINMSFALIPCDQVPMSNFTSYVLSLDFPSFAQLSFYQELGNPHDLCNEAAQDIIERDGIELSGDPTCEGLAATADNPNLDLIEQSKQAGMILLEVLSHPNFQPIRQEVFWASLRQRSLDALDNVYGSGPQNSLTFAKLAQAEPQAMELFFDAPDADDGENLNEFCASLPGDANCIAVASAGNDSLNHPYEPASYRHVIAASGLYDLPSCSSEQLNVLRDQLLEAANAGISEFEDDEADGNYGDEVDEFFTGLFDPIANAGEVAMDGVYNGVVDLEVPCLHLWGTSFSAPRLSLVLASYLAAGGSADTCSGNAGDSKPPLNFSELNEAALLASAEATQWPDLTLEEAKAQYCSTM